MHSSGRVTPRWTQRGQAPGGEERPRSAAAAAGGTPPAAAATVSSPTYAVVYSSDDSFSDGELHVERRAGSLAAWYKRGSRPQSRAGRLAAGGASSSSGEDEEGGERSHSSLRVVLHSLAGGPEEPACGEDADAASPGSATAAAAACARGQPFPQQQQGAQPGVSWETNNLFDYLKGLYQQGAEEVLQGGEFDSEEWARRTAALRELLRERDGEVAQLQAVLEHRQSQLAGREADVAQQAQCIAALEERIRALLRQLEEARQAALGGAGGYISAGAAKAPTMTPPAPQLPQKRQLAAAFQPQPADSYFVQLPAQSYVEHRGCGFWQGLVEGVQRHPRRSAACGAAFLLLLLLVILCATLIPAAQRRRAAPKFAAAPSVAATGATWLDLGVRLDRPGLVSWMAFRQADLNRIVPGEGRTLLQLIQDSAVRGRAVHAASAPGSSLDPGAAPQAGLQALAVACGWAPLAGDGAGTVSVQSASSGAAAVCSSAAGTAGRCARCPQLEDGTPYTLLLAASSASGRGVSRTPVVVNALTGAAAVNVNGVHAPFADNATATAFDLHFKLNKPGTLFYAIAYDTLYAPYGARQLAFGTLAPPASAVVAARPASFRGGLVANGSLAVERAGAWVTARIQPPCVGALCQHSLHGLQGGTAYQVFLVAVDRYGNADPAPAVAPLTTAPATAAPALLPATAPSDITDSSFGASVSTDAAGGVYYQLLAAKPGAVEPAGTAGVAPGQWARLDSLADSTGGRRRLAAGQGLVASRQLLEAGSAAVEPGSLVAPVCYPDNQTCTLAPAAVFSDAVADLAASFEPVASGCLAVPAAGAPAALPAFTGLQNNTLHLLLLASEDRGVPQPARLQPPVALAVRTVDLSAPQLACGFPLATNITATGFALSAMLTKPGASVFFVVLPAGGAGTPPSPLEVLQGRGPGGAAPAAAGNLTRWGHLPWEAAPAGEGAGDPRKLWEPVGRLPDGGNYTGFFVATLDGATPAPGSAVSSLSGILTPATTPPTFTRLQGLNASVDEARGTFSVQLSAGLDRGGQVYFALYRNYSCIQGEPSAADVVAGAPLPPSICKCEDRSYCALVTAGSFGVPAQTLGAVHSVGGDLSPLPFQALRAASEAQLKCFQGGLGQATDTYNIYLVASNAQPTHTGLAPQCSNFAQAAGAAAAGPGTPDAACPAARQLACNQAQLRPDSQALQAGAFMAWPFNATGSSSSSVAWQQPGGSMAGRPAKVQLSLEGGAPPAFTYGPAFPPDMRAGASFGMQFALDKPALLIYAVFRVLPIDASGKGQAPVLVATGRVPVFDAAQNATTGAIAACPWAPGGPLAPVDQLLVTYVARDKYGRMDGLCPGQAPGSPPRVCSQLAFT